MWKKKVKEILEIEIFKTKPKLSTKQKAYLFRQISYLIKSGISVEAALIKIQGKPKTKWNQIVKAMILEVRSSGSLNRALKQSGNFEDDVIYQVVSGETSGNLPELLLEISTTFQKNSNIERSIQTMLLYPVFLLIILNVATTIISMMVIPEMEQLLTELQVTVNPLSAIIIQFTKFNAQYGAFLFAGAIGLLFIIKWLLKKQAVKNTYDKFILKLPLVKDIVRMQDLIRYSRVFSSLYESGVKLQRSMDCAANTVKNMCLQNHSKMATDLIIKHGTSLPDAIRATKLFEETEIQLIDIGAETDQLKATFSMIVENTSFELEQRVKSMMGFIEPVTILIIGIVVGFFVVGIYAPFYSIISEGKFY